MGGYRCFWRDRQGRRGGGVVLYVTEGLECVELTAGHSTVESLWVRGQGQTDNADTIVGV